MPTPFSSTFSTVKTNLTWTFTTEDRENLVWEFSTRNAELTWSFQTPSLNAVWTFITESELTWSFTTEDRANLVWTFDTIGLGLVWSFTTDDGITTIGAEGSFVSFAPILDSDCKDIRIGVGFGGSKATVTYNIRNLRTSRSWSGSIAGTPTAFGVTLENIKDGIYEVVALSGSTVEIRDYLLVLCNNCLYEQAIKESSKSTCIDCQTMNELRAITNVIKASHSLGEFDLAHGMMDILDDICTNCDTC